MASEEKALAQRVLFGLQAHVVQLLAAKILRTFGTSPGSDELQSDFVLLNGKTLSIKVEIK